MQFDLEKDRVTYTFDQKPQTCPICHVAIDAAFQIFQPLGNSGGYGWGNTTCELVYACPHSKCGHYFIAYYREPDYARPHDRYHFYLHQVAPYIPKAPSVPEEVERVSPMYPVIYAQALAAENFGLDQIAGMGYRKALEFLVTDFCIETRPADEPGIRAAQLQQRINNYVTDVNIKEVAKRAVWLGNDETHYERKWVNKDISDLKSLIQLTVNWIDSTIRTRNIVASMTTPPPPTPPTIA